MSQQQFGYQQRGFPPQMMQQQPGQQLQQQPQQMNIPQQIQIPSNQQGSRSFMSGMPSPSLVQSASMPLMGYQGGGYILSLYFSKLTVCHGFIIISINNERQQLYSSTIGLAQAQLEHLLVHLLGQLIRAKNHITMYVIGLFFISVTLQCDLIRKF